MMLRLFARKPIAKKTRYLKYGFVITEIEQQLCPRCKEILNAGPDYQPNYCGNCGQKIDFRDTVWVEPKELGYERDGEYDQFKDRVC